MPFPTLLNFLFFYFIYLFRPLIIPKEILLCIFPIQACPSSGGLYCLLSNPYLLFNDLSLYLLSKPYLLLMTCLCIHCKSLWIEAEEVFTVFTK